MFELHDFVAAQDPHAVATTEAEAWSTRRGRGRRDRQPVYSVQSLVERGDPYDAVFEDVSRPARHR